MATSTKKGYTVLSSNELNEMRARANLIEKCKIFVIKQTLIKAEMLSCIK